jgi:hypothetical protein
MAKEEDITARLMTETVGGGYVVIGAGDIVQQSPWGNYEIQETTAGGSATSYMYDFVTFGYFDLSGYSKDDKTVFPQSVILQRVGTSDLSKLQTLVNPTETIVISTTPLSMNDMTIDLTGYNPPNPGAMKPHPPGSMVSGHSNQQIILGEQRVYTLDVGAEVGRIDTQVNWGVGDSTANDKLYYARAIRLPRYLNDNIIPTAADYGIQLPDLSISIPVLIAKEDELAYMMRLQRSVVLDKDAGKELGI